MTREFKMPPDAFRARTERGSAKGLMRIEASSHPEGASARLPMFLEANAHGEQRTVFSDDAIRLIRELIREEIAASKVMPEVRVTLERAEDGILERITRTAGEVTDRFRLLR